jgi:hypothetical protein
MNEKPKPLTKEDVETVDRIELEPKTQHVQSIVRVIREKKVLSAVKGLKQDNDWDLEHKGSLREIIECVEEQYRKKIMKWFPVAKEEKGGRE